MNDQPTIKYSYLFDSKPLSIENIKGEKSGFPPYQACDTPEQARNVAKREWESQRTALEKKDLTWAAIIKGEIEGYDPEGYVQFTCTEVVEDLESKYL